MGKHDPKVLVAYFSATGTTARTAEVIAQVVHGDLYEIVPEKAYTDADLNWHDKQSRSSVEMDNEAARPAMKGQKENIADYDVVFICYPIWWNLAPRIIHTFIESHDLKGKAVVPFATSGGSAVGHSVAVLKVSYPDLDWQDGRLLNHPDETTVRHWLEALGVVIP